MFFQILSYLIIFSSFRYFGNCELPSYIKVCKQSDPNLSQCIINSINELVPYLKAGIPELEVPEIEPLHLDEIKLRTGPNQAKIHANITNIKVWGPSDFKILNLKANVAKKKFIAKVLIPELYFQGDYDIDMSILLLKYKGQGPITGNFTNYEFDMLLKGHKIVKDGKDFVEFEKMQLRLNIGKSHIYLGDLFLNDQVLAKATNDVIQDNSDIFINEIKPALENTLAELFTDISNKITTTFTYQELFPVD